MNSFSCHLSRFTRHGSLPLVMRKRFVGFRHAMRIFFLLDGVAAIVRGVENLSGQPVGHGFLAPPARVTDNPANCERAPPLLVDFDRDLIGRAADPARFDFDCRPDVIHRALKDFERLFAGLFADLCERVIENIFGDGLLTVPHHTIDELSHQRAVINRIGQYFPLFGNSSSWHNQFPVFSFQFSVSSFNPIAENWKLNTENYFLPPLAAVAAPALGRFAPYLERPCLRSATPTESSVPRMT